MNNVVSTVLVLVEFVDFKLVQGLVDFVGPYA